MSGVLVEDLVVEYVTEGYRVRALDGITFKASPGEIVALLGPSGSGKTTLLSCLAGILTPSSGMIRVADVDVTETGTDKLADYRRRNVGIVFQAFNLIPSLSARENVAAPLLAAGVRPAKALARADELLGLVGLSERAHHRPGKLSGGQQQRVAIARALVHDPPVLLADEPTANLDYVQAEAVVGLLRDLRGQGRTIVISTHDDRIIPIADSVVSMVPESEDRRERPGIVEYVAGESIFEQGARGRLAYVIEQGKVDIVRVLADGGERLLATIGAGQYFGELAPLIGFPRSASARAKTDVVLRAYPIQEFRELMSRPGDAPVAPDAKPPARRRPAKKVAAARKKPAAAKKAAAAKKVAAKKKRS